MTQDEFIDKWLVGYESREQKEEFAIEMMADLESLQSKGKTSAEEFLRDKYKLVDFHDLTLNGKPWVELMEEYAQSHANQDGWVSCAERFPELHSLGMSEDVLTIAGTKMRVKSYDHELKRWNGSPHITVTHWMPLPPKPQI